MRLDRRLRARLAHAVILQAITWLLLRILPFATFKKVYRSWKRKGTENNAEEQVYAVSTAGRFLKSTCLVQALVLKHLLADSRLVIGVSGGKTFEAHAWVERNGKIILGEMPARSFAPLWVWE